MTTAAESGPMAMFPLQSALLPGQDLPLQIFEPRYTALVRDCLRDKDPRFGVVLISQGREKILASSIVASYFKTSAPSGVYRSTTCSASV